MIHISATRWRRRPLQQSSQRMSMTSTFYHTAHMVLIALVADRIWTLEHLSECGTGGKFRQHQKHLVRFMWIRALSFWHKTPVVFFFFSWKVEPWSLWCHQINSSGFALILVNKYFSTRRLNHHSALRLRLYRSISMRRHDSRTHS